MMIRLAVLDGNSDYIGRLLDFCREAYSDKLELSCFSAPERLTEAAAEERFDVILVDETMQAIPEGLAGQTVVAWLTGEVYEEKDGLPAICRYQRMEQFYREVLALYAEHSGHVLKTGGCDGEGAQVIAVVGAAGGCGASCVAAALAVHLAQQKRRVTYVNLEPSGEPELYFHGDGKETLSDLLYALKSNRVNLALRMESIIRQDPCGVRYYAAPTNALERAELTEEDAQRLLTALRENPENQAVVLDIPLAFQGAGKYLLEAASRILMVTSASMTGQAKLFHTVHAIKTGFSSDLLSRMALVGNRGQEPPNHMGLPLLGVLPEYAGGTERQVVQAMSGHSIFDLQ